MPKIEEKKRKIKFSPREGGMKPEKWILIKANRYIRLKMKLHSCTCEDRAERINAELEKIEKEMKTKFGAVRSREFISDMNSEVYLPGVVEKND